MRVSKCAEHGVIWDHGCGTCFDALSDNFRDALQAAALRAAPVGDTPSFDNLDRTIAPAEVSGAKWDETNPEWWRAQVELRADMDDGVLYQWLVNEWAATAGREPLDALREALRSIRDMTLDQPAAVNVPAEDWYRRLLFDAMATARAALDTPDPGASS